MKNKFWQTLGLATVASMRSMTAPALLSKSLVKHKSPYLGDSPLRFMQSPITANVLSVLAGAELIGDKQPEADDRTAPTVLPSRAVAGALIGAVVYKSQKGSALTGALLGSVAAVATSYATLAFRKQLISSTKQPVLAGVIEDSIAVSSGLAILQGRKGTKLTKADKEANTKAKQAAKARQMS
ncbi:DUF4126 family protein [Hymenobacter aerilatus]|uniref:DUF4126 family protein n=1 Tax=Hymenobacter aerilatus TaxID=2932251 RepID=A0A8T9SVW4_9BACT|nr:DUF4126 family protein [Hymenobacter aerilatus]UOR06015.1 DUF4126 family protein [Hymenobacter aerilatus]